MGHGLTWILYIFSVAYYVTLTSFSQGYTGYCQIECVIFSNGNIPSLVVMSVSTTGVNILLKHLDCQGCWHYFLPREPPVPECTFTFLCG